MVDDLGNQPTFDGPSTMPIPAGTKLRLTARYRSALIGIAVHSAQTVMFTLAALAIVLK